MGTINIRLFDAERQKLTGSVDLTVTEVRSGTVVAHERNAGAGKTFRVEGLKPTEVYEVRVFPVRHRPIGRFATVRDGKPTNLHLFCPLHPDRAQPSFPVFANLDQSLIDVLERSVLEADDVPPPATIASSGTTPGERLYKDMTPLQKAGLLNLHRKMDATRVGPRTAWDYLNDIYRARGDRIFANVAIDFRDQVKTGITSGAFEKVSGVAHTPGPGFRHADSFKTPDAFANLQLTFFSTVDEPLRFRVDADIDDANGIGCFKCCGTSLPTATRIRSISTSS